MIPEIDIWRTDSIVNKRYGDTAEFETCIRADGFAEKGDRDSMRVWLRILKAIDQLQTVQPGEGKNRVKRLSLPALVLALLTWAVDAKG